MYCLIFAFILAHLFMSLSTVPTVVNNSMHSHAVIPLSSFCHIDFSLSNLSPILFPFSSTDSLFVFSTQNTVLDFSIFILLFNRVPFPSLFFSIHTLHLPHSLFIFPQFVLSSFPSILSSLFVSPFSALFIMSSSVSFVMYSSIPFPTFHVLNLSSPFSPRSLITSSAL